MLDRTQFKALVIRPTLAALAPGCHQRTVRRGRAAMKAEPGPLLKLMQRC
jgi:hypothetical protein